VYERQIEVMEFGL